MIPKNVQNLIDEFSKLPGVGPKSAQRLTFFLLRGAKSNVEGLGEAVLKLKNNIGYCQHCWNLTEVEGENAPDSPSQILGSCVVCEDEKRERSIICVVEEPLDVIALEKTRQFKGIYHVLHGAISPIEGIGPDELYVKQLVDRVASANGEVKEIILAMNPNLEGETTAMYIQKLLQPYELKVTRIARGLPVGGDIEYADEVTLTRALEGRREY
ncbi:recombination protein RecR [bacterium (Candidatus Howlettbacteria) CG_4_10_14_0_8_um_filter_40_9]|nr:MAG: recombination protein RecR [bacterium (Candidatus Howlettbacteria) CG_4_10_14_0_8_um_filter_40_9]